MATATAAPAAPADQIVVTATREATLRTALPESTGVLDEKALAEAHLTHPSEIMGRIPGVYQAWLSGNHHTTVIRQPINFNPLYLYLENGVPKQAAGFFETNAMFDMNVSQAARMEITKGPGTALYGSDAIAGVINVMTPLPTKEFSGSVEAQGSTRGYKQGLISLGGTSGSHGVRADVNIADDSGWRDDTESDHQMGTFTWLIDNDGPLTVRNVLVAVRANQDSPGSNLGRADYENNPRINLSPIDFRLVESLRFYSHMDYDMGDTLVSLTPFFRWGRTELLPFFALAFDPHYFEASATSFGGQLKLRHDITDKLRLIVGADVDYTTGNRVDTRIAPVRDGPFYVDFTEVATVYDFNAKALTLSPYAHAEWQALPRLRITAGIRYDYAHYDYTNNLSDLVSSTALHNRPPDQKLHFDDWSPKAGITYDITNSLNAYVSWRRAFRVPTTSQLFRPGRSTQSTGLKPVKAESFEAGLRGTWDRVQFEVSAYTTEITDDILVFTNNATGVRDIRNSGNTRHQGVEAGITIAITPTLEIAGAYARNDHHFIEWAPVPGVDLSGNKINRAPKDIGSARIVWRPAFLNGGRLEASYEHLGSYYLDDDNTRTYEGHDLIHVSGSIFVAEGVELFLRLHNLLNERYATNGRYTAFGGDELKPGLPRTLFGGVGVTF